MRLLSFGSASFDIILAGQVLHHLREDAQWEAMFQSFHEWLRPAGTLFVADFVAYDDPGIQKLMLGGMPNIWRNLEARNIVTRFWLIVRWRIRLVRLSISLIWSAK